MSRAVPGYNGGDRGAYTKHVWYWNGNYCYTSSSGSAAGEYSSDRTCQTGWNEQATNHSGSNATTTWKYWETWQGLDPTGNSGRAVMSTCWDVKLAPDTCSSSTVVRGAVYADE